jgi:hypothetical protein
MQRQNRVNNQERSFTLLNFLILLLVTLSEAGRSFAENSEDNSLLVQSTNATQPFYGTLGFPKENYTLVRPETYPGVYGINITSLAMNCSKKILGSSKGGICKYNNKTYYLKNAEADGNDRHLRLNEISNGLVAASIGVVIPNMGYFINDTQLYLASEQIRGFEMAIQYRHKNIVQQTQNKFTAVINEIIGSHGISQLTVLKTLFEDLNYLENWGINPEKKLSLVDADKTLISLEEYFNNTLKVLDWKYEIKNRKYYTHAIFDLSLDNLADMKSMYSYLYHTPLPAMRAHIKESVRDTFDGIYPSLLKAYIYACNEVMCKMQNRINPATFHSSVNSALVESIKTLATMNLTLLDFVRVNQNFTVENGCAPSNETIRISPVIASTIKFSEKFKFPQPHENLLPWLILVPVFGLLVLASRSRSALVNKSIFKPAQADSDDKVVALDVDKFTPRLYT